MFGGIPGKIGSMLSHINPNQYRENLTGYKTQQEYEDARTKRQNRGRIDRLRKTRDYGKYANDPEGWAASDLSGRLTGFEKDVFGKDYVDYSRTTPKARDLKALRDQQALTNKLSANDYYTGNLSFEDQVDKNKSILEALGATEATGGIMDNYNYNNMKMMEVANNPALSRYKQTQEFAPTKFNDPWAGATVQQVGMNQEQLDRINKQHQTNLAADEGTTNFFEWLPGKKYVENFVGDIKGRDKTKLFSDTPKDIVYGDPTTGATTQEIRDYINSLSNVHGPIKNQNPSGYARKNLIGVAQGGRIGYKTGGLASLWPR